MRNLFSCLNYSLLWGFGIFILSNKESKFNQPGWEFKILFSPVINSVNAMGYMPSLTCCSKWLVPAPPGEKCGKFKKKKLYFAFRISNLILCYALFVTCIHCLLGNSRLWLFSPQYLIVPPCLFHLILCSVNIFHTLQCNFNSNYIFNVNFTFNSTYKLQKNAKEYMLLRLYSGIDSIIWS